MRAIVMTALLAVGIVATASAQPVARLADVARRIDDGARIRVVDARGQIVEGRLSQVTADELVIEDASSHARAFAAADVRQVSRRGDSLANGMLWGAIIGGVLGGALGAGFSGEFRAGDLMAGVASFGGAGLLIGLGVDAANVGWTTVYAAPSMAGRADNRDPGRLAVRAVLRW
jgi:hypothetical protein